MNEFILTLENIEKTYVSSGETLTIIKNLSLNEKDFLNLSFF